MPVILPRLALSLDLYYLHRFTPRRPKVGFVSIDWVIDCSFLKYKLLMSLEMQGCESGSLVCSGFS